MEANVQNLPDVKFNLTTMFRASQHRIGSIKYLGEGTARSSTRIIRRSKNNSRCSVSTNRGIIATTLRGRETEITTTTSRGGENATIEFETPITGTSTVKSISGMTSTSAVPDANSRQPPTPQCEVIVDPDGKSFGTLVPPAANSIRRKSCMSTDEATEMSDDMLDIDSGEIP